jgi:hypothetical protein
LEIQNIFFFREHAQSVPYLYRRESITNYKISTKVLRTHAHTTSCVPDGNVEMQGNVVISCTGGPVHGTNTTLLILFSKITHVRSVKMFLTTKIMCIRIFSGPYKLNRKCVEHNGYDGSTVYRTFSFGQELMCCIHMAASSGLL